MSPQLRPANASSTQPSSESEVTGDRADYDLVQRLRAGDDRAFAEIVGS